MSASWFLVSTYLIWIFGSKLTLSNNQPSAALWVLDTCLIVGLRPLKNHLDHGFVVLKNVQLRLTLRRVCLWVHDPHLTIAQILAFSFQLMFWIFCPAPSFLRRVYHVLECCLLNVTPQSQCPKDQEHELPPCAIQHPTK